MICSERQNFYSTKNSLISRHCYGLTIQQITIDSIILQILVGVKESQGLNKIMYVPDDRCARQLQDRACERLAGALRVTGSISAQNKYLYDLQMFQVWLLVYNYVCKYTHDTEEIPSVGQLF